MTNPGTMVTGSDDNVWFINPLQIVAGSDGNIWFYSAGATHAIVKMTPGGTFTGYPMPTLGEIADNMVLGPDG